MRLPRVRFTVRRMMGAVAIVAITLGLSLYSVAFLRDPAQGNGLTVRMNARAARSDGYVVGQPIPIAIDYNYSFVQGTADSPAIPFGKFCDFRAEVWIEEEGAAGRPPESVLSNLTTTNRILAGRAGGWVTHVDTFDERIVAGLREKVAGKFTWPVNLDRPGRYTICYTLSYRGPLSRWKEMFGSVSRDYQVHEGKAPVSPSPRESAGP